MSTCLPVCDLFFTYLVDQGRTHKEGGGGDGGGKTF